MEIVVHNLSILYLSKKVYREEGTLEVNLEEPTCRGYAITKEVNCETYLLKLGGNYRFEAYHVIFRIP